MRLPIKYLFMLILWKEKQNCFAKRLLVFFALFLFVSPQYFPSTAHFYLIKIIGIVSVLYSVTDIKEDSLTKAFVQTDASILENISGISSTIWGIIWFFISIGTVIFLLYFSYKKGLQKY